ncbi:MAG: PrgI family protein [Candidatus Dojkabacteria bacterium]|nr:MAG: PrgI family protein [Candidatus Dojkabacteria bacterium]
MKQHPIPQNILDVEFKLFTKFTVREFIYMAAGIGFGGIFLYFATRGELTYFIAVPIFLISSAIGLFLGLVPINEQKADTFLTNYIAAITRPTRRVWRNEQFDRKVEGIAEQRGLVMTQGEMSRNELPASSKNQKSKIIGGVDPSEMGSNQFMQSSQVTQALDMEEEQRLAEIENIASTQVSMQSSMPQPQPMQQEGTAVPESTAPAQPEQPAVEQPQMVHQVTPLPARPRVTITKENISQFQYSIEGLELHPNTIYLHLQDSSQPLHRAMVMLRDTSENILQVYQTDGAGNLVNAKPLKPGEYLVDIEYGQYNFPRLHYVIEQGIYPPILVTPLN